MTQALVPSTQGGALEAAPRATLADLKSRHLPTGTDAQFRLLIEYGRAKGLDLVAGHYYGICRLVTNPDNKTGPKISQMTIQIGIDGYRMMAQRTGEFDYLVGPEWCGPDGEWRDIWLDDSTPPYAARVGVVKKGSAGITWGVAKFSEFVQTTNEWAERNGRNVIVGTKPNEMWAKMGSNQLAKVAEAQGLRKACPAMMYQLDHDFEEVLDHRGSAPASIRGDAEPTVEPPQVAAATKRPRAPIQQPRGKSQAQQAVPPLAPPQPTDIGEFREVPDFDDEAPAAEVAQDFQEEDRPMDWKVDASWFWARAKEYGYDAKRLHEHLGISSMKEAGLTKLQCESILDGLDPTREKSSQVERGEAVPDCAVCFEPSTRRFGGTGYCGEHLPSEMFTEGDAEPL